MPYGYCYSVDENGFVTITNANLDGKDVSIEGDGYTLALDADVPQPKDIVSDPTEISSTDGTFAISEDGVYKFEEGFSGTVTISATNVKLIGASSQLSNVSIDLSAVEGANLWIENLYITSNQYAEASAETNASIIRFGSGTNTLTVRGTNVLENTADAEENEQALINVGGGLNIIGDGELTAKFTGAASYGAAIGSDCDEDLSESDINISGSVKITAEVNITGEDGFDADYDGYGAGIGSGGSYNDVGKIGNITIGGNATVTATAYGGGKGIGAGPSNGTAGTIKYGTDAYITVDNTVIGDNDEHRQTDVDITPQSDPAGDPNNYGWTALNNGSATYMQLTKTAGYVLENGSKSITYHDAIGTELFSISGIVSLDDITVEGTDVIVGADALQKQDVTLTNAEGNSYALKLGDDVPQSITMSDPTMITSTNNTISADGVYKFEEGFSGTVTISARNVKLIGASSQLSNVSIDLSAVENANLWIEDLYITSSEEKNVILFGSGTNTLTVAGENTLVNTKNSVGKAVINVGGGLNIIGDSESSLTASFTGGNATGAAIGTDEGGGSSETTINIGGSVTITANANGLGAGIGSGTGGTVGDITIGGNANVTASSTEGAGIGAGSNAPSVTVSIGTGATVNGEAGTFENVTDVDITAQSDPAGDPNNYGWTALNNGSATYMQLTKTAGYVVEDGAQLITYHDAIGTELFSISGIASLDDITVEGTDVIVGADALKKQNVTLTNAEGNGYALKLGDDVPQSITMSDPTMITSTNNTISADGVYKFEEGFSGTLTISARNVKLIGAGSKLSNVSIDLSAVEGANLWIENLDITSDQNASLIKFGEVSEGGANTLTVKGTNTLINTSDEEDHEQALINVGGGLNIIGDGSLTARLTGESYGAAIGSDYDDKNSTANINIGGSVTVTAEVTGAADGYGAGIGSGNVGSIGAITIGGNATVTAAATDGAGIGSGASGTVGAITIGGSAEVNASATNGGEGIGKGAYNGSAGTILYGTGTTVTNKGNVIGDGQKEDVNVDEIAAQSNPGNATVKSWVPDSEDNPTAVTYRKFTATDGYALNGTTAINYTAASHTDLLEINGATAATGDPFSTEGATVTASDITAVNVIVSDESITDVLDVKLNIDNQLYTPKAISKTDGAKWIETYDAANAASDVTISLATTDNAFRVIGTDGFIDYTADVTTAATLTATKTTGGLTLTGGKLTLSLTDSTATGSLIIKGGTFTVKTTVDDEITSTDLSYAAGTDNTDGITIDLKTNALGDIEAGEGFTLGDATYTMTALGLMKTVGSGNAAVNSLAQTLKFGANETALNVTQDQLSNANLARMITLTGNVLDLDTVMTAGNYVVVDSATAPTAINGNITLTGTDYDVNMAVDATVEVTPTAGAEYTVNGKKYTAADTSALTIKATATPLDSTLYNGTVTLKTTSEENPASVTSTGVTGDNPVEGETITAANGSEITATATNGAFTSIGGLDAGEAFSIGAVDYTVNAVGVTTVDGEGKYTVYTNVVDGAFDLSALKATTARRSRSAATTLTRWRWRRALRLRKRRRRHSTATFINQSTFRRRAIRLTTTPGLSPARRSAARARCLL